MKNIIGIKSGFRTIKEPVIFSGKSAMNLKRQRKKSFQLKYGATLLAIGAATVLTLFVTPLRIGGGMYFLFLTAVVFSSLYAGYLPGILTTVLSLVICFLFSFYTNQTGSLMTDLPVITAFAIASGFTVLLYHTQLEAETARRRAEDKYRMIFENAITGIYETTVDGSYVAANPKLAATLGYETPEQLIIESPNLNLRFYTEPERRNEFARLVENEGNLAGFESEILRRDGEKIWISENALAVRDSSGNLIGFQGTTIEITDRKHAENALQEARERLEEKVIERTSELAGVNESLRLEIETRRQFGEALLRSEDKFRNLVETTTDWIWETNEKGIYTYASPQIKNLIGYEPHEIVGKRPYDLMPPEEALRIKQIVCEMTAANRGYTLLESFQIHKNGSLVVTETSSIPFYDNEGNLLGARGIARDITERKRAKIALRRSEMHLRSIVVAAPVVLFAIDAAGIFTLSEGKSLEYLDLQPGQLVGQSVFEIYRNVPQIIEDIKRTLIGESFISKVEIADLIFESRYTPVFDENGTITGMIGVSIDITERQRIETELLTSQRQLRELSAHLQTVREEERRHIARELHDELGQTLTALKIDLVRLGEKSSGKNKIADPKLLKNISPMLAIVDSAMETTRKIVAELRPGILDELGLAAALEWQVQEFQKRTGINCELQIVFNEPDACQNLKITIFRILQECLTNIARHSGAERTLILLKDENWRILFEVEDNGRGITDDELKNTNSFGVLGMKERVLMLGGTVEISRLKTGGTRVSVSIPRPEKEVKSL